MGKWVDMFKIGNMLCWAVNLAYSIITITILYLMVKWLWYFESERLFGATTDPNFFSALSATSALFTGLAVVASAFAVALQVKSLNNAKAQIAKQQEQLDKQLYVMKRQSFENSFFSLLNMHREIGREAGCSEIGSTFKKVFDEIVSGNSWREVHYAKMFGDNNSSYLCAYNNNSANAEVGIVIRIVNSWRVIVKFIVGDQSLSPEEKMFYFSIFRSQLSDYECALIALHAVGNRSTLGMKSAIESYGLFSGFQMNMLEDEIHDLYHPSAFGLVPPPAATQSTPA